MITEITHCGQMLFQYLSVSPVFSIKCIDDQPTNDIDEQPPNDFETTLTVNDGDGHIPRPVAIAHFNFSSEWDAKKFVNVISNLGIEFEYETAKTDEYGDEEPIEIETGIFLDTNRLNDLMVHLKFPDADRELILRTSENLAAEGQEIALRAALKRYYAGLSDAVVLEMTEVLRNAGRFYRLKVKPPPAPGP